MEYVPDEILFEIMLNLPCKDLISYCAVDKHTQTICQDIYFWKQKIQQLGVKERIFFDLLDDWPYLKRYCHIANLKDKNLDEEISKFSINVEDHIPDILERYLVLEKFERHPLAALNYVQRFFKEFVYIKFITRMQIPKEQIKDAISNNDEKYLAEVEFFLVNGRFAFLFDTFFAFLVKVAEDFIWDIPKLQRAFTLVKLLFQRQQEIETKNYLSTNGRLMESPNNEGLLRNKNHFAGKIRKFRRILAILLLKMTVLEDSIHGEKVHNWLEEEWPEDYKMFIRLAEIVMF